VKRVLVAALLATSLSRARPAAAEEQFFDAPPAAPPPREQWYGWQTLAVDGVAAAMATTALALKTGAATDFWGLGIGTYALGAPIIHVVHGRPWVGLGDLGLRLGVPFVGMFIGSQFDHHMTCVDNTDCTLSDTGMIAGGLIGASAISVIDAAALTYETPEAPKSHYAEASRPRIWPSVAVTPRGSRVGIAGTF
jgi:hypothetical protein